MSCVSNRISYMLERFPTPHEALNHLVQIGILIREVADCSPTMNGFTAAHTYRICLVSQTSMIEAHGDGTSKAKARDHCVKDAMSKFRNIVGLDSTESLPYTTPPAFDAPPYTRPVLGSLRDDSSSRIPIKRLPLELVRARLSRVIERFPVAHEALNFMEQSTEISRAQIKFVEETAGVFIATQRYEVHWGSSSDYFLAKGVATSKPSARASCYTDAVAQLCTVARIYMLLPPCTNLARRLYCRIRTPDDDVSSNDSSSRPSTATSFSTTSSTDSTRRTLTDKQMRSLEQAREHVVIFDRMMDCIEGVFDEEPTLLLAVDVEANEKPDHTGKQEVLEVGIVREKLGERRTARSVVVEQRRHVKNVHTANDPEAFAYGQSEYIPAPSVWGVVQQALDEMKVGNNRFVVVHTYVNDHKWLVGEGIDLDGVSVCDIAQVQRYWDGVMQNEGLVKMSQEYGVSNHAQSHSGGNDAWTTMDILLAMVTTRRPWLAHAFHDQTLAQVGGNGLLPGKQDAISLL